MALFLLPVIAVALAAADDIPVLWSVPGRAALACQVPAAERLLPRRPPPPLSADRDDRTRPRTSYVWRKGADDFSSKRVNASGTLELRRRDGEGVYQCAAKHMGGLVLGYPLHLKFASMEKQFTSHPVNVTARAGQPLVLSCDIASAPAAVVTWRRDDEELGEDSRYHMLGNQLLITEVKSTDVGSYRCIATNTILKQTRTSHPGRLEVQDGGIVQEPAFLPIQFDTTIQAKKGSKVVLPCPVIGWPRPSLMWKQTPPGGRTRELDVTDQVFVLQSLDTDEEGVYTCQVENTDIVKTFNISIIEPAIITIPPLSREAPRASTVRFNCTATGKPEPKVTWYKDGLPLVMSGRINLRTSTDGKRIELVKSGVTSDDAGVYQCFAQSGDSITSAWAFVNVTGAPALAPRELRCWPAGARAVKLRWQSPPDEVVAYTVHTTLEETKAANSLPGQPHINTEETVTLDHALTTYRFQVRAYVKASANTKNVASDLSESVVCQGQGVPVRLMKEDRQLVVSWQQFAEQNPGVLQWILQTRGGQERNVTLEGGVLNYTLAVSPSEHLEVRVLGTRSLPWTQQDLSMVPWVDVATAGDSLDAGEVTSIPQDLEVTQLSPRSFTVTWRADDVTIPDRLSYMVCVRKVDGNDKCIESTKPSATFEGLQPNSEYEVRVQVRVSGRALGGAFSQPFLIATPTDGPQRFQELAAQFVNASTLRVSWNGPPGRYTVHYSAQLRLPVEQWDSVETDTNTALITGIDPTEKTFVMVTGYNPLEHRKIETIPPYYKDLEAKDIHFAHTTWGLRVWWTGLGPKVVRYTQNITQPTDMWLTVPVSDPPVEISALDTSVPTYLMVESKSATRKAIIITVPAKPRNHSSLYLGVGIGCGMTVLFALAAGAVFIWRRRKRARSPVRSRRRNLAAAEGTEEGTELKGLGVGGRLANGGACANPGQPLLNGHVHITENPTQSKAPNGRPKKGRRYEAAFDVSRFEDPDATLETVLDADTSAASTTCNLLDTSRRPDLDSRSSREVSANNSFNKLPDDNMNSELTRSEFALEHSRLQPMLQPNG